MQRSIDIQRLARFDRDGPSASVLLVDDRDANLAALKAILEPLNQRLVEARSGTAALRYLLNEEYACILMDVQMPDMDGFETVNLIKSREKCRHIPVIFVTALSKGNEHIYQGYSTGAVDYISKPINPEVLRSKVAVFIDLYLKEQEIKHQAEMLNESIRREAEQKQAELERRLEQAHLRDLAEKLEIKVNERTQELVEANRDLEAFCYSIAHDLRTPIREIVATSNFLLEDAVGRLKPDELENLKCQSLAAKRMGRLIDDLLRLSRLGRQGLNRQQLDLSAMAAQVCGRVLQYHPAASFELEIAPGVSAFADPGLIEILLQNLFENAVKYSPNGGKIEFGTTQDDGKTTFFVSDQGIGFDMQYERKLFLPFERLVPDPSYPGTGIGLAMVHKIVAKHGGKVWAKGETGKGSTFFFNLDPLYFGPATVSHPSLDSVEANVTLK